MREKVSKIVFTFLIIGVLLYQFTSLASNSDPNALICWGLKRSENHSQPTLDTDSVKILDKYDRNFNGKRRKPIHILNFRFRV